jgi:glycosyltransferase involved in cell wall biosynthesis
MDTRILYKECKSLTKAGYDVTLIAMNPKLEVKEGVRIIPFPSYKNRFKRLLISPFKMFFLALKEKAVVYHFHDPELIITGLLLKIFTNSKIVYDIHENYSKTIIDRSWIKFKFLRLIISKLFLYFELMTCKIMSANVVVLPNWLNKYAKAVLVRNYPILETVKWKKNNNLFVYVGVMSLERSSMGMISIFIELIKLSPNMRFKIIGVFGEKKLEADVMDSINRCPNIDFLGYRPFVEVKKMLSKAKYGFVLYSSVKYLENIPVKMYEYLANEVIPIFSSFEGFKYEIESEGWGIGVNPKNPKQAAKKIYDIIMDKEKLRVIEKKIKKYKTKYSWESEKRELLNLYNKFLKSF